MEPEAGGGVSELRKPVLLEGDEELLEPLVAEVVVWTNGCESFPYEVHDVLPGVVNASRIARGVGLWGVLVVVVWVCVREAY